MEEKEKRLKLTLGCSLLIVVLLLSAKEDSFQKVINDQTDALVIGKLEEFRKQGIQQAAGTSAYEAEKVIEEAFSYLGTPASMGGTSHKGIDCSGLVMKAHESCGMELPHSAEEQARYGKVVANKESLERGDVVFFYDSYSTSKFITHSGIYLGENEFIHTSTSKGVTVSKMDDSYWEKRFLFGTRF